MAENVRFEKGNNWVMYNGDCVEVLSQFPENSIDYSVFSPPFSSLYTFSNSDRDMGNCKDDEEFFQHYSFLVKELNRVIKPGRLVSIHCMQLPTLKERDGYIGIKDFRGDIVRSMQKQGFIFHSEVCIWKCPLLAAVRTKAIGLLHKQLCKDSTISRQGLADYIVTFRKKGENECFVKHEEGLQNYAGSNNQGLDNGNRSHNIWRRYASPVWDDIRQKNVLNVRSAKDEDDEKHLCPLQLDVIDRCLTLWSNPGDVVLTPFGGIGSEVYQSVSLGRKAIGIELKESYFNESIKNLCKLEGKPTGYVKNYRVTQINDLF